MWKRVLLTLTAGGLVLGSAACGEEEPAAGGVNLDGKKVASMADYGVGKPSPRPTRVRSRRSWPRARSCR
ncbi:hypothetical protein [Saccharothrix syringae]|uniref:hypothetical protein n=1 Tax=Saccharothrix syringae TaxID=103733 RepID=UPI0012F81A36|nr:hypothetical protein [Saccharothrix syringae]